MTVALSVSTSTSSWPICTWSPSATSQREIVPSSIESDSLGMVSSVAIGGQRGRDCKRLRYYRTGVNPSSEEGAVAEVQTARQSQASTVYLDGYARMLLIRLFE